jgi:glucose/arabinose dehydrogenase
MAFPRFSPTRFIGFPACALLFLMASPARLDAQLVPTNFADEGVVTGLDRCTGFDFLPDGRILVLEQYTGNVRLIVNETLVASPIYTVPDLNTGGERGLLGVAVDPAFPARPYVYFHYTHAPEDSIFIARFTVTGDLGDGSSANLSLGNRFVILDDLPDANSNHNGGTVRFGPDGMLLISIGDDGGPGACAAQDSSSYKGKILRIDVSGIDAMTPEPPPKALITPPDNPFPAVDPIAGIVYCLGLRNPFRFTVDPYTGALYIGNVGEQTYEALDEAPGGGENFGWPFREGPMVQDFAALPCDEPGGSGSQSYDGPIAYYSHAGQAQLSIIAGPCYRPVPGASGNYPLLYNGAVFYADFYQGFVRVLKKEMGSWAPLDSVPGQPDAVNWGQIAYPSQFMVGPDGAIYYTKLVGGELRRIVYTGPPVTGVEPQEPRPVRLGAAPNPLRSGDRLTLSLPEGELLDRVTILGIDGRRVRSFARVAGPSLIWDGRDAAGRPVPAGVYFVQARGPRGTAAARVVVVP